MDGRHGAPRMVIPSATFFSEAALKYAAALGHSDDATTSASHISDDRTAGTHKSKHLSTFIILSRQLQPLRAEAHCAGFES